MHLLPLALARVPQLALTPSLAQTVFCCEHIPEWRLQTARSMNAGLPQVNANAALSGEANVDLIAELPEVPRSNS